MQVYKIKLKYNVILGHQIDSAFYTPELFINK